MAAHFQNSISIIASQPFRISLTLTLLFLSIVTWPTREAEATEKKDPDAVYVVVEQARLYAGPSSEFYPTGELKRGAVLEVYHQTNNGWLGVRPPQGSFSWVPASQAYQLPGGRVIEVTDASAVSWIGTEFGAAKQYRWQVQLNVGEQLTVLGEATIKNGSEEREALWYKVAPPAGEFRWIEQAAVSKTAPAPIQPESTPQPQDKSSTETQQTAGDTPEKQLGKKSAVQPASFDTPAKGTVLLTEPIESNPRLQQSRATKPNSQATKINPAPNKISQKNNSNNTNSGSEWDGWYAFEIGAQGIRSPLLEKLSGRESAKSKPLKKTSSVPHDPLLNDPFSLEVIGKPATSQRPVRLPTGIQTTSKEQPGQHDWRDPRSLRDSRLGGSPLGSLDVVSIRPKDSAISPAGVQLAGSPSSVYNVKTAGFESMQPTGSTGPANVNWFGLTSQDDSNAAGAVISTGNVAELQLALNTTVSSSGGPWNLTPLADRASYLIEHGPTALDRGQARLLLERIQAFQNVSARSQPQPDSPVHQAGYASNQAASPSMSMQPTASQPTNASSNYDATGWLVPVHAGGLDQPSHALTSDTGDIIAYVSPLPGLNLDRYRNQAVGITGLRGYLPQLQAAHIQAQRVSRIR